MNAIRSGKIARLAETIREQVNQRLVNHESSTPLLAWLNALPEVQEAMAQDFGGRPIDKHNLHQWRHGGFAEWQEREDARKLMERLGTPGNEMAQQDAGEVLGMMTTFATARYVMAVKRLQRRGGDGETGLSWERLREFCGDLVALRRGEQLTQRLEFEREQLAWWREKSAGTEKLPASNIEASADVSRWLEELKRLQMTLTDQRQ